MGALLAGLQASVSTGDRPGKCFKHGFAEMDSGLASRAGWFEQP